MALTRRTLLTLAGAGMACTTAALAGCTTAGGTRPQPTPGVDLAGVLPNHTALRTVQPDLTSQQDGGADAFFAMPQSPSPAVEIELADHGPVRFLGLIPIAPPAAAQNAYWQELDRRLGCEIAFEGVPNANYVAKFQTVVAGDDLPDLMQLRSTIPRLPQFVAAKCLDLTDLLAGDAVAKYPALANIPTSAWRSGVLNGRLHGVPAAKNVLFGVPVARGDVLSAAGVSPEVNSGEELLALLRAVNRPEEHRWATTVPYDMLNHVCQMLGAPNEWRVESGKLVRNYETPEYEQAIGIITAMWQEGLFHPESFDSAKVQSNIVTWLADGTINFFVTSPYWGSLASTVEKAAAGQSLVPLRTPTWAGDGLARRFLVSGATSVTAIPRTSADRVEDLLQILNWAAAPFGSEENLFRDYGTEGVHFTWVDGAPVKTDQGTKEIIFSTQYLASSLRPHYQPGRRDLAEAEFAAEQQGLSAVVANPVDGLYSEAAETQGPAADLAIRDVIADIVQQRRPASDWSQALATWRQRGGDAARGEFEAALTR